MPSPSLGRKPVRLYLHSVEPIAVGVEVPLATSQYRHLISALRRGAGDPVDWFDGSGRLGTAILAGSDRTSFGVRIETLEVVPIEPADRCTLILGIPKPEALDTAIDGATQAGVGTLLLVPTERTPWSIPAVKRDKLLERWRQSVIDTAEQSGRITVPRVKLLTLAEALEGSRDVSTLRVASTADELGTSGDSQTVETQYWPHPVRIAVGPEGGWSDVELALLAEHGGIGWHLPGVTLTTWMAASILPALWRWGIPVNNNEICRW